MNRFLARIVLVAFLADPAIVGAQTVPDAGVDAGTGWNAPLYSDCPKTDALAEQVDGGSWLVPALRAARQACLMETCREREELWESRVADVMVSIIPEWFFPTLGALLGLGVGIVIGYAIGRAVPR